MQKTEAWYLGILIDTSNKINWKSQIRQQNGTRHLGIIKTKKVGYVNLQTMKSAYYALVYSYLQYGTATWGQLQKHLKAFTNPTK